MTEDQAREQAANERRAFLENLQREGDRMAEALEAELGLPVEFELKPSHLAVNRARSEPSEPPSEPSADPDRA